MLLEPPKSPPRSVSSVVHVLKSNGDREPAAVVLGELVIVVPGLEDVDVEVTILVCVFEVGKAAPFGNSLLA